MRAKFTRYNNPRKTLGINSTDRTDFKDLNDFANWVIRVFIPDYYDVSDVKEGLLRLYEDKVNYALEELGSDANPRFSSGFFLSLISRSRISKIENLDQDNPGIIKFVYEKISDVIEKYLGLNFRDISDLLSY